MDFQTLLRFQLFINSFISHPLMTDQILLYQRPTDLLSNGHKNTKLCCRNCQKATTHANTDHALIFIQSNISALMR